MFGDAGSGLYAFDSPRGGIALAWTPRGVCRLEIGHDAAESARDAVLADLPGLTTPRPLPAAVKDLATRLRRHLRRGDDDFGDVPVVFADQSAFARKVLRALRRVPPGETVTYGDLARRAGRPGAARAVGRIMGANPVPVIVPCHRCVGADGSLTGFSAAGGVDLKARLLHDEGWIANPEHAAGLAHLSRADKKMARIIRHVGPYRAVPDKPRPPYDTLVTAIVHQQLSVKAGQTIAGRVRDLTPGPNYPTPDEMLALDFDTLRACGLSRAKVGFVQDLAAHVADGRLDLRALRRMSDDEVVTTLTAVKGIGEWSAHMHLIFHLGRLDVLPVGDLGIRMGAARVYGLDEYATPAQLRKIAAPWAPYRSLGSWYLWRALDSGGI